MRWVCRVLARECASVCDAAMSATLREKRYADGLAVLLDYARAQKAIGQDCDPTFIERCAYTWLQEPAQAIIDGEGQ
jgi:hypothetical protein